MFRIGDFSRLSFVTVKTLRYYDEIGLLKPVRVDRFTGYRYYSADQLPRLNYIIALKESGLKLEEIHTLVNDGLSTEQMKQIFTLKQAELRQRVSDEQRRLEQVENLLIQLEKEGKMSDYQVVMKKLEPVKIASVRGVVPTYHDIGMLIEKLMPVFQQHGDAISGPFIALYHDGEYMEKDVDMEAAVPIKSEFPVTAPVTIRDLPAVPLAATTVHRGPYEGIHKAYQALMTWCDENGYELDGPDREVYLNGPESTNNPEEYVSELQQPVKKR